MTRPLKKRRPDNPPPPRLLWDRREAAARLHISLSTLDRLLRTGQLDTVRIGARRLVPEEALVAFARKAGGR